MLRVSLFSCFFYHSPSLCCLSPATCIPLLFVFVSLSSSRFCFPLSSSCLPSPALGFVSLFPRAVLPLLLELFLLSSSSCFPAPPATCIPLLLVFVSLSSSKCFPSSPVTCIPLLLVFVSLSSSSCFPSSPVTCIPLPLGTCVPLLL